MDAFPFFMNNIKSKIIAVSQSDIKQKSIPVVNQKAKNIRSSKTNFAA